MTIKEIAALASVSPGTVSKVLNNKDESISAETRKKILQIVKEQHYRPYAEALESSGRRSYLLGILFPDSDNRAIHILKTLEPLFAAGGYNVLTGFYRDADSFKTQVRGMRVRNVDAVLTAEYRGEVDDLLEEMQKELPVFKIAGTANPELSCLILDDRELLAQTAADYLIAQGHSEIGLLSVNHFAAVCMAQGCAKSFFGHGLVFDEANVFCEPDASKAAHEYAHLLINRNVTAIICETMDIVCGVYQTCMRHGLRIPEDISVICLEDKEAAEILKPQVTVTAHRTAEWARQCADAVLASLEDKRICEMDGQWPGYQVVVRQSVSEPLRESLTMQSKVLVLGSMNMDETIHVKALPSDGETILSDRKVQVPGGKGANQAVGVARLGGSVYAMGRIGNDIDGRKIFAALKTSGVMTEGVQFDSYLPTGKAYIHSADNGESTIVVYPGANQNFNIDQIEQFRYLFERVGYCLLPIEIMAEPMMYVLRVCREYGVVTIVKPSLQTVIPEDAFGLIDYLIPNEKELDKIVRDGAGREEKMDWLLAKGVGHVLVTLGSRGCHLKDAEWNIRMKAPDFEPVDVTGAADAFIAAFTVYLNMGYDSVTAMCYASYGAGISITRMGVQPALADKLMMEVYQDEIRKQVLRLKGAYE